MTDDHFSFTFVFKQALIFILHQFYCRLSLQQNYITYNNRHHRILSILISTGHKLRHKKENNS